MATDLNWFEKLREKWDIDRVFRWIETIILLYLCYMFFPSGRNIFSWFFKFVAYILIVYVSMFWIGAGLDKLKNYIKGNYKKWIRDQYDFRYGLKQNALRNELVGGSFLYIIQSYLNRFKYFHMIKYYTRYERLASFIFLMFAVTFIYAFYKIFFT